MFFTKTNYNKTDYCISNLLTWKKRQKKSNGSNKIIFLKLERLFQYKFKTLLKKRKWASGRSTTTGRITVFSKGPWKKNKIPLVNYSFRQNSLYFIGGVNSINSFRLKVNTIVFTSSGSIFFKPLNISDKLFSLVKLRSLFFFENSLFNRIKLIRPFLYITKIPFLLLQQDKNSPISFLELHLTRGAEYSRSVGSSSKLVKLDTRIGYGLVILPSALKKVFSIFSLAADGPPNLGIQKSILSSNKSGDKRKKGIKPRVRGIAMNPVDHPHGGRTNSIKFPRTPWGKVTKYK